MDRTIVESSSRWKIRDYARYLPPQDASALLTSLSKSTVGADLLRQLLLQEENSQLRTIKDLLEQNPIRFDPNPFDYLPVRGVERSAIATIAPQIQRPCASPETAKANLTSLPDELLFEKLALPSEPRVPLREHSYDQREKFEFLQLLEQDTKDLVACPRCIKLHHWRKVDCEFTWLGPNSRKIPYKFPYIPRFYLRLLNYLDYGFARTVGRLAIQYGPESPHCQSVLKAATPTIKSYSLPTASASRSISSRLVDGNIISRSQISVAPFLGGRLTPESFNTLVIALTSPRFQICDHLDFRMFLWYLDRLVALPADTSIDGDEYPNDTSISDADRWGLDGVKIQDNYAFYVSSEDTLGIFAPEDNHNDIPSHIHEKLLSPALYQLLYWGFPGQVRSCLQCATDFGLGVQYVPGVGKTLVMSIWRDIGGPCQQGEDELRAARKWKWDSHRCDRFHYHQFLHPNVDRRRLIQAMAGLGDAGSTGRGAIYKAFEAASREVKPDDLSPNAFMPELDSEDIAALEGEQKESAVSFEEFFALEDFMARERQRREIPPSSE